jgi:hypothetical protein
MPMISLLQHANDLMAASSQRGGTTFNFKNEQGKISLFQTVVLF